MSWSLLDGLAKCSAGSSSSGTDWSSSLSADAASVNLANVPDAVLLLCSLCIDSYIVRKTFCPICYELYPPDLEPEPEVVASGRRKRHGKSRTNSGSGSGSGSGGKVGAGAGAGSAAKKAVPIEFDEQ